MGYRIRLTFLGTSATFPTKDRNHPSFLIEFEGEGLLFDCGEGVQRQLRIAGISPTRITKILLTHWHGDHVLGLGGIFQSLNNSSYNKTLEIYGPVGIKEKIEKLLDVFDIIPEFHYKIHELYPTENVVKFYDGKDFELYYTSGKHFVPVIAYSFKEKDITKIDVEYLKRKVGIIRHKKLGLLKKGKVVTIKGIKLDPKEVTYTKRGFKISYITDTLFQSNLIELAKESNILVIESMYFLDENDLAFEHRHLSLDQSLEIFERSCSDILALVHISQRYSKEIDKFEKVLKEKGIPGFVVEDFDQIIYVKSKITIKRKNRTDCELIYDEKTGKIVNPLFCFQ